MQRALWNPVCAGCILAFVAYHGNINMGANMIDSMYQLRAWTHIYNALLQTSHISRGEIPLLDFLYEKFEKCKSIWQGPFPARGQFTTRWWISLGMSLNSAQNFLTAPGYRMRSLTPIEPQSFMKSYERIGLREYYDEKGNYQSDEQNQDWERLYNTMNAIQDDEQLLAFNWISLGHFLNDAYMNLFDHCGWMSKVAAMIENTSNEVRMSRRKVHRNRDLAVRSIDYWKESDDLLKYKAFLAILARFLTKLDAKFDCDKKDTDTALNAAAFMKKHFLHLPLNKIQWFDSSVCSVEPTEHEEKNDGAEHQA
jgi:hypothetical protein